jgi:hypothetical protein
VKDCVPVGRTEQSVRPTHRASRDGDAPKVAG